MDLQSEAYFTTLGSYLAQDRMSQIHAGDGLQERTGSGDFGEDFPNFSYSEKISKMGDIENLFKVEVRIRLDDGTAGKDLSQEAYVYRKKS
jgi:hypothetical protein